MGKLADPLAIDKIRSVLLKRKEDLIRLAREPKSSLDETDRQHILEYLQEEKEPKHPQDIETFLKVSFCSFFSYSKLRKYHKSFLGDFPTPDSIGDCLSIQYSDPRFKDKATWSLSNLKELALEIIEEKKLDDVKQPFIGRVLHTVISGVEVFETKLSSGLEAFYDEVGKTNKDTPLKRWKFAARFSKPIWQVKEALTCDCLKNLGFTGFVKVDHHFSKEFPALVDAPSLELMSDKQKFIASLDLCGELDLSPFLFDHVLYQWGRYKKYC